MMFLFHRCFYNTWKKNKNRMTQALRFGPKKQFHSSHDPVQCIISSRWGKNSQYEITLLYFSKASGLK